MADKQLRLRMKGAERLGAPLLLGPDPQDRRFDLCKPPVLMVPGGKAEPCDGPRPVVFG